MRTAIMCAILAAIGGVPQARAVDGDRATLDAQRQQQLFSTAQVTRYTDTLVEVRALQRRFETQRSAVPESQWPLLRHLLSRDIAAALARNELKPSEFNAITAQVDRDATLRGRVKQHMMEKVIGT